MKSYVKYVECADCGRKIPICNAHYISRKPYGYNCYKKQLVLLYKQWEDEKNVEYSAKCFAAIKVFEGKRSNSFHDSICKQWNECKKLTAKQLECIIKGFNQKEKIDFWCIWFSLTNDEGLKRSIPLWIETELYKNYCVGDYIENEAVIYCLLYDRKYKNGFHFCHDIDDKPEIIYISENKYLQENLNDEDVEILKVVEGVRR